MIKRTARALALVLSAAPLLIVGCGDSGENKGNDGSSGGLGGAMKYDGGGGAGGAKMDVGLPDLPAATPDAAIVIDTLPAVDVTVTPADTAPVVDAGIPDAPIVPDAPIDSQVVVDTAAIDTAAVDATPAIDATVVACTMTTPFTGGDVTANLTLTKACSPYTITDDIRVNGNATLTIEAGATLRFQPDVKIWIGDMTAAKIVAVGTATSLITFTSANTTPGAGDWAGIRLWDGTMNGTTLAYAKFDYCGSNGDACILGDGAKANRVSIDHVTISHVGSNADGIWQKTVDSNFAVSNCTFNNISSTPTQQYAISVYAPSFAGIDSTNTFANNAMVQLMGGTISVNTTWKNLGTNITVAVTDDIRLEGAATPALTISAGSIFKFAGGTKFWIGNSAAGNLKVNGTLAAPVVFTSLSSSPAEGDWEGITLWGAGRATITYATISYGGGDSAQKGNIIVDSDTSVLDIQNSKILNSSTYGIGIRCGSTAAVTNTGNTFAGNVTDDVGPGPVGPDCP